MTVAYIIAAFAIVSTVTSLIYIGLGLLADRNRPCPHQDTDSQSAISAGEGFERHVAPRNTTVSEQDHAAQI